MTVKQMIRQVLKNGAPRQADELTAWLKAYYPNEDFKVETVARRLREIHEANREGIY